MLRNYDRRSTPTNDMGKLVSYGVKLPPFCLHGTYFIIFIIYIFHYLCLRRNKSYQIRPMIGSVLIYLRNLSYYIVFRYCNECFCRITCGKSGVHKYREYGKQILKFRSLSNTDWVICINNYQNLLSYEGLRNWCLSTTKMAWSSDEAWKYDRVPWPCRSGTGQGYLEARSVLPECKRSAFSVCYSSKCIS